MQCERGFQVHHTGGEQSIDITSQLEINRPWNDREKNAELIRKNSYRLEASFFESGIFLEIDMYSTHLNFRAYVPDSYTGRTQGFLGNLDSNPNNEFHLRDNTIIPNINSDREIFPHLEEHCE